jgi:hypothetical protein
MKRTAFVLTIFVGLAGLLATLDAQTAKPNFTGTWTLDLTKSDFGQLPPPESMVLVIEHKEPTIRVKSTQRSAEGEVANDRTLTTDGKPNRNNIRMVGAEQVVTSTSKWDGAKFVTTYPIDMQGTTINFVDTWDVSGTILTILREVTTPDGVITVKSVFVRK